MDDSNTFVSPEGVYTHAEEHRPPLPTPIYSSVSNAPTAASIATRISTVLVNYPALKTSSSQAFSALLGGGKGDKKDKKAGHHVHLPAVPDQEESVSSGDAEDGNNTNAAAGGTTDVTPTATEHPPHHPQLFSPPTATTGLHGKKKSVRAKQNLKTTTSSFVSRYHCIEGLQKHLSAKTGETTFIFYNAGKTFYVTETDAGPLRSKDPLIRVTFNAWPTCHAVNEFTASSTGIDVIIGFHSGDLLWFDPLSTRYVRLNKQGCITNSPCTAIRWVPGSRNLFLVSHANGTIVVYDKEREDDTSFQPSTPPTGPFTSSSNSSGAPPSPSVVPEGGEGHSAHPSSFSATSHTQQSTAADVVAGWNSLEDIWVTRPGGGGADDRERDATTEKEKEREMIAAATKNPVSHWRVSRKSVVDLAFSPDVRYVAVVSEDGNLRIIDALLETLVDTYAAYFGVLTCLAWSPDGRFIAVGGQDDLITIYSPQEQRVIARCQGHYSFVSGVVFDPLRCDGRTYRFASVGEDCKLILWDFSSGTLHRPRLGSLAGTHAHRNSLSSQYSLALRGTTGRASLDLADPFVSGAGFGFGFGFGGAPRMSASKYHPAPSRNEVAVVQPVLVKSVEGDILSSLSITPNAIFTASRPGITKVWTRPAPPVRGSRRGGKGAGVFGRKKEVVGEGHGVLTPQAETGPVQVVG
ncbi:hypothetical protein FRB90_006110 [Tulasnella sp. 427]|nr:hypothetical protein FRB90_006110 [Tulasnella sp. 427]